MTATRPSTRPELRRDPRPVPSEESDEVERERPPPPRDPAEPSHIEDPEPVEPAPFQDPEPAGPGFTDPKPWDPRKPESPAVDLR